jgi:hypothetical protein
MKSIHKVSEIEISESPEDGGKYVIYCEHTNSNGEIFYTAVLQDTNKKRLAKWRYFSEVWCDNCREESEK